MGHFGYCLDYFPWPKVMGVQKFQKQQVGSLSTSEIQSKNLKLKNILKPKKNFFEWKIFKKGKNFFPVKLYFWFDSLLSVIQKISR